MPARTRTSASTVGPVGAGVVGDVGATVVGATVGGGVVDSVVGVVVGGAGSVVGGVTGGSVVGVVVAGVVSGVVVVGVVSDVVDVVDGSVSLANSGVTATIVGATLTAASVSTPTLRRIERRLAPRVEELVRNERMPM